MAAARQGIAPVALNNVRQFRRCSAEAVASVKKVAGALIGN